MPHSETPVSSPQGRQWRVGGHGAVWAGWVRAMVGQSTNEVARRRRSIRRLALVRAIAALSPPAHLIRGRPWVHPAPLPSGTERPFVRERAAAWQEPLGCAVSLCAVARSPVTIDACPGHLLEHLGQRDEYRTVLSPAQVSEQDPPCD